VKIPQLPDNGWVRDGEANPAGASSTFPSEDTGQHSQVQE